jgi:D-alanine-D-alanine ligase
LDYVKKNIAIIFGGKSTEHEISIKSAKNIFENIDRNKYKIFLLGINKLGEFFFSKDKILFEFLNNKKAIKENNIIKRIGFKFGEKDFLINLIDKEKLPILDIVFPITHGTYGEDGCLQGFLKLLNIPFVGSDVMGSGIGMDKDVMRRLLQEACIPGAKTITLTREEMTNVSFENIKSKLGIPVFIKPASLGSSVGIHKVFNKKEFEDALKDAFLYDKKIVIEEFIEGREVECSVLGNQNIKASTVGEVITNKNHEFYSYDAKYLDKDGAKLEIPVDLSEEKINEIRNLSIKTYKTLNLEGFARVDSFVNGKGVFINEVNTLPGFTSISMYPKLWDYSGISYKDLISELIDLAFDKFRKDKDLKSSFI